MAQKSTEPRVDPAEVRLDQIGGTELSEVVEKLKSRLKELEPALREADQIRRMLSQVEGTDPAATMPFFWFASPDEAEGVRKPLETRKSEIVALARQHPGIRPGEIAKAQGLTISRVSQITGRMVEDGELVRVDRGFEAPG